MIKNFHTGAPTTYLQSNYFGIFQYHWQKILMNVSCFKLLWTLHWQKQVLLLSETEYEFEDMIRIELSVGLITRTFLISWVTICCSKRRLSIGADWLLNYFITYDGGSSSLWNGNFYQTTQKIAVFILTAVRTSKPTTLSLILVTWVSNTA